MSLVKTLIIYENNINQKLGFIVNTTDFVLYNNEGQPCKEVEFKELDMNNKFYDHATKILIGYAIDNYLN